MVVRSDGGGESGGSARDDAHRVERRDVLERPVEHPSDTDDASDSYLRGDLVDPQLRIARTAPGFVIPYLAAIYPLLVQSLPVCAHLSPAFRLLSFRR